MNTVQILYAGSVISRTPDGLRQTLSFAVMVKNYSYEKCVDIHWAGSDGTWRVLACHYARPAGEWSEVWKGEARFEGDGALPGDVTFAVHAFMEGVDYWDSDDSRNYTIKADAGLWVSPQWPVLNVRVRPQLEPEDVFLPVTVAVHQWLLPHRVFVRWSTDNWRTTNTAECYFWRRHWERVHTGSAHNPSDAGAALWVTHIPVEKSYRVEYAIGCEGTDGAFWDNNGGCNYLVRRERLKVMTLNLHCCQEADQDAKLWTIARAIEEQAVDIVCLQEVAQPWDGANAFEENTAKRIRDRIRQPYQLVYDWSHRGFDIYREGCAILSRHPIRYQDSGYVSPGQDENSINSRRVVMVQADVPFFGLVNVFSIHLSWWQDGFRDQFDRLNAWAREKHAPDVAATLILGDFNARVGGEGYAHATLDGEYEDQYLKALRCSGSTPDASGGISPQDGRIDHILLRRGSRLDVKHAREVFTAYDYGRVSDHIGYCAEFEPPV